MPSGVNNALSAPWFRIAGALLLLAFAGLYAVPIGDIDFWWHVSLGGAIVRERGIPVVDPFGMYATGGLMARLVLAYAWLGQVLFYAVFTSAGATGIVLLRSWILVACLAVTGWRCRASGISAAVSLAIVALGGAVFLDFLGERPNLLSFLCAALLFLLIDALGRAVTLPRLVAVPALLALWGNLHGGAALGGVLVVVLGTAHAVQRLARREPWTPSDTRVIVACAAGALATMASPLGADLYRAVWAVEDSVARARSTEYLTPFAAARDLGILLPAFWALLALAAVALPSLVRRRELVAVAGIAATSLLALGASRYVPFFVVGAAPFIARGLAPLLPREPRRAGLLASALSGALLLVTVVSGRAWRFGVDPRFPQAAVATLRDRGLGGRVFNHLDWGGYLLWNAWPALRPFIDGRTAWAAADNTFAEYTHVLWATPTGLRVLDDRGFDLVMIPWKQPATGEVYPLPGVLDADPRWERAHADTLGVVYRRRR